MVEPELLAVAVDDETMILTLIEEIAREASVRVISFTSPEEAFPFIQENEVDMIFTDYRMPQMDGISFIRELRRISEDIPIVMVTVFDDYNIMMEAIKAGATEFVPKPINAVEFLARVRNLSQLRRSQLLLRDKAAHFEMLMRKEIALAIPRESEELALLGRALTFTSADHGHSLRVAEYSRLIARGTGASDQDQRLVYHAALIHDLGRPVSAHDLIVKKEPFSPSDIASVTEQVLAASSLLENVEGEYLKAGRIVILSMYERFDGTGHPRGLKGEEIPYAARIIAVAEFFDLMVCLKSADGDIDFEYAVSSVRERGNNQLDPSFSDVLVRYLEEIREIHHKVTIL